MGIRHHNNDFTSLEAAATRDGASRPWLPFVLAVNRTRVLVAGPYLFLNVTRLAAVLVDSNNGTGALLDTATTIFRTHVRPSVETRLNTVDRARKGHARVRRRQSTTRPASTKRIGDDGTRLGLGTSTAGLGASTEVGPARSYAVNGARVQVTGVVSDVMATGNATVGSSSDEGLGLGLGTNTASFGAGGELRPTRKLAVNGTTEGVARGESPVAGTSLAAIGLAVDNRLGALLGARTASGGACRPCRPPGKLAVNGARLSVASTFFLGGAVITTMLGSNVNLVGTRLGAGATSLGAGGPSVPGVFAVNGARVRVAVLNSGTAGATNTTMLGSSDYRLRSLLEAAAAQLVASAPGRPSSKLAINGTGERTAGLGGGKNKACNSTVLSRGDNRAGTAGRTRTTSLGAARPCGPSGDLAVDGAGEGAAGLVLLGVRAADTTVKIGGEDGASALLGASATGGSAGSEGSPGSNLAVDGAGEGVASLHSLHSRTFNTVERGSNNNGARALLGAGSASGRAGTESRPAGNLAVNGTGEGIASLGGATDAAASTTVAGGGDDTLSAELGAGATSLGAGRPGRPGRKLAVNGARLGVANALFLGGASVTTVAGSNVDGVVARLLATTTRLGASGPGVPGMLAINGARVGVAVLFSGKNGGSGTTVGSSVDNRSSALVNATAAELGASAPGRPARHLGVDGAGESVAGLVLLGVRAADTAKCVGGEDGASALLGASATGGRAGSEGSPGSNLAVDGAGEGVASLHTGSAGTSNATVGSSVYNGARALLGAGGASGRAGTEGRPGGYLAVNGAGESVASYGHAQSRADSTTVHGSVDSGAGLGLLAGTTSGRAGRIASPGRHLAVDGTGESVAGLNTGQGRASLTAVGSSDNNRASALLGAGSASGRARSESRPCGNLAINGTGEGAASSRGGERRATSTAKAGNSDDGTRLSLGTSTARLSASTVSGPA